MGAVTTDHVFCVDVLVNVAVSVNNLGMLVVIVMSKANAFTFVTGVPFVDSTQVKPMVTGYLPSLWEQGVSILTETGLVLYLIPMFRCDRIFCSIWCSTLAKPGSIKMLRLMMCDHLHCCSIVSRLVPSSLTLSCTTCSLTIPLPLSLGPQTAISSSLHDSAVICGPIPNDANISLVVLLRPSAWPRGVGPGCFSMSSTLISELRNQLANASLDESQKVNSQRRPRSSTNVTYPAGPAPMMRMSTVAVAVIVRYTVPVSQRRLNIVC